jgi:hypothetical protein
MKLGVGCMVRVWVFHNWRAMEEMVGMHLTRQAGANVIYPIFTPNLHNGGFDDTSR